MFRTVQLLLNHLVPQCQLLETADLLVQSLLYELRHGLVVQPPRRCPAPRVHPKLPTDTFPLGASSELCKVNMSQIPVRRPLPKFVSGRGALKRAEKICADVRQHLELEVEQPTDQEKQVQAQAADKMNDLELALQSHTHTVKDENSQSTNLLSNK